MPNNVNEVLSGKPLVTGGILVAPLGTALPTTAAAALNASFVALGYATDDGVTESVDRSTDKVKAWGGDTIAVPQTDFGVSYGFTLAQALNALVLRAVWGDAAVVSTVATASTGTLQAVTMSSVSPARKSYVIEVRNGNQKIRIVIPNGQLTQSGDTTYQNSTIVTYPVTLDCLPDASGNSAYKYTDDAISSTGAPL